MKRLVRTSIALMVAASLMAMFAGSALAAPDDYFYGEVVMEMVQPDQTADVSGFQIAPGALVEVVSPQLTQVPGDDDGVPPTREIGDGGPTLQEVPLTPATPEEQETPGKQGETDDPEPETPEVSEEPETPEVDDSAETAEANVQSDAYGSKLPNTGTKLMLIALGAIAMIGGAPLLGIWADNRLNRK